MSFANWVRAHVAPGAPSPPSIIPEPEKGEPEHHDAVTEDELTAGIAAVRAVLEETGYSSFVSDAQCRGLALKVLTAAAEVRG